MAKNKKFMDTNLGFSVIGSLIFIIFFTIMQIIKDSVTYGELTFAIITIGYPVLFASYIIMAISLYVIVIIATKIIK